MQHPTGDNANSEYAEVNLSTFHQSGVPLPGRGQPPEPYATTALCLTAQAPRSMVKIVDIKSM